MQDASCRKSYFDVLEIAQHNHLCKMKLLNHSRRVNRRVSQMVKSIDNSYSTAFLRIDFILPKRSINTDF